MATVVITGRDVGLSFTGGTDIQAQATNAVLTKVNERQVYQTMEGEAYKTTNISGTFQLDMLADWDIDSSIRSTICVSSKARVSNSWRIRC
jgi:preprotein translocase subunit SecF